MANLLETIVDTARDTYNSIVNVVEEQKYQSSLECYGIAMRQAMKPYRYYGRQYPYVTPIETDYIRTNNSYVAASGWRPTTYQLKTEIHDKEWEKISSNFDVQDGGSSNVHYQETNNYDGSDKTLVESYGSKNNYDVGTGKQISVNTPDNF